MRLFHGAYRLAGSERTFEQQVMAGTLAGGDGAVASHRAAAALLGMPGAPRWVEITVPRTSRVELEGVIAHRTRLLGPEDVARLKGIPTTTPVRTIVDLARVYPATKVGPMLDHALARRLVTRARLEARASGRGHNDVLRELLDERPVSARPMGSEFEASFFSSRGPLLSERPTSQGGFAACRLASLGGCYSPLDPPHPDLPCSQVPLAEWILPITYDLVVHHAAEAARQVRDARGSRLVARGLE